MLARRTRLPHRIVRLMSGGAMKRLEPATGHDMVAFRETPWRLHVDPKRPPEAAIVEGLGRVARAIEPGVIAIDGIAVHHLAVWSASARRLVEDGPAAWRAFGLTEPGDPQPRR